MVHEINGDALAFKDGIICHQTNYHGVMGAGIAAAIRHKLLTRQQYAEYVNTCMVEGRDLLGRVQYFKCRNDVIVANCFCQDEARQTTEDDDTITSYGDMRRCLKHVRGMAERGSKRVCIPYKMGCGIAGGDWNKVRSIIESIFGKSDVEAVIVRRPGD